MSEYAGKVVIVTGGAKGIGRCVAEEFVKAGAQVCVFDLLPNNFFTGDLAKKEDLERFAEKVLAKHGHIDYIIHCALPLMKGLDECTYEEFLYAQQVGVVAPFYLVKLLKAHFHAGASVILISSTRDRMSQAQTESYSAAKGGISALTHSMAMSLAGIARVNAISPGWIDTTGEASQGADQRQHPVGRVGHPMDIAQMVMFLCNERKAGFITGENICIDGGMTRQMIYHHDFGWEKKE